VAEVAGATDRIEHYHSNTHAAAGAGEKVASLLVVAGLGG